MECICHQDFDAQKLITNNPPRLLNPNKKIVFAMTSPPGAIHSGVISFSRWQEQQLPDTVMRGEKHPGIELRNDYFPYDQSHPGQVDWYLNFAHYDLFFAYGGSLFAQDEIQVAEHPALASLRHGLISAGLKPLAVEGGAPTPALIMGVERRGSIATEVNTAEGRPDGLYGNTFFQANADAVRRATTIIDPATISHILAIEAPACGAGQYTREQIEYVVSTAFTGFSAVVHESRKKISSTVQTIVHTGYWGCGAYGGNQTLMPLLQMVAACGSELDSLVFHAGADRSGYDAALELFEELLPVNQKVNLDQLLNHIESIGFSWGISDGN